MEIKIFLRLGRQISHQRARSFFYLNLALLAFTLLVMLLGPLVRAEGAGLACPDWPLCKGELFPQMDYQVLLEWLHRLSALLLSLFFLFWTALAFYDKKLRESHARLVLLSLFLLLLQIALGALTITESLDAYIVNSHLLNAVCLLGLLFFSCFKILELYGPSQKPASQPSTSSPLLPRSLFWLSSFLLLLVFFQIFMGARVSTHKAGRVCNSFPACYYEASVGPGAELEFVPQYFPPMEGDIEKHMSHRFTAYLLFLTVLALFSLGLKKNWPKKILYLLGSAFVLTAVQILIGALNVLLSLPVSLTVLHSFFAYLLYLISLWLFLEVKLALTR